MMIMIMIIVVILFNLDSWKGGDLKLVYMNRQARKLLSGLNMEQKLKLILFID